MSDESADFLLDFKRTLELTAAQWLSFSDDPDPDPLADFKRALEATGERWLSFSDAVALLREREPMSIGQAK